MECLLPVPSYSLGRGRLVRRSARIARLVYPLATAEWFRKLVLARLRRALHGDNQLDAVIAGNDLDVEPATRGLSLG
jgi:hypothetical protein